MPLDQTTVLTTLAVLALAYGAIRFLLLPWLAPRLLDWVGDKTLGEGYQKARSRGASFMEAFAEGKKEKRDAADRALATSSGVPLRVISVFRQDHPQMFLTATVLPEDEGGPRYRVCGEDPEVDGYSSARAEAIYRGDGARVPDEDDDTDDPRRGEDATESISWEDLPENIRRAASAAVPGGRFVEAYPPVEDERYYVHANEDEGDRTHSRKNESDDTLNPDTRKSPP